MSQMKTVIRIGVGQLGPVSREESKASVVKRLVALMQQAKSGGCDVIVYPEMALTTFFPRWVLDDPSDADAYCESELPNADTAPLFTASADLGIGFYLGFAELVSDEAGTRRYNSTILADKTATIVGKYRKVHICGLEEADPNKCEANFEKCYFTDGDLGFPVFRAFGAVVGMLICNDRRWPEAYRVLALKGADIIMIGYNTGATRRIMENGVSVMEPPHLPALQNALVMQAGAYQNGCWVVGAAKAGLEDGQEMLGGSCIISPSGDIVAQARTRGDELVVADCDLGAAEFNRRSIINFETERRIKDYALITSQRGIRLAV